MCRAKDEGPRCSHGGRVRMNRAEKYMDRVMNKATSELERKQKRNPEATLSEHTQWQVDNAKRRMRQAEVVRYATNDGVKELQGKIDVERERLSNMPDKTRVDKSKRRGVQMRISRYENKIEQGNSDRYTMRANARILGPGEKRDIRNKMMSQGAEVNSRAQRALPSTALENKNSANDKPLALREWDADEVRPLASRWVEEGTRTGWQKNDSNIRPSTKLQKGTLLGQPSSNMFRMNTPDGQVGEVRIDVYQAKMPDGTYAVETRRTSAATNLQSSPYDTVGLKLGALIGSKTGVMSRREEMGFETFKTEKEANAYAKKAQRAMSQTMAVNMAVEMRSNLVKWAGLTAKNKKLQTATQPGSHLYSAAK